MYKLITVGSAIKGREKETFLGRQGFISRESKKKTQGSQYL